MPIPTTSATATIPTSAPTITPGGPDADSQSTPEDAVFEPPEEAVGLDPEAFGIEVASLVSQVEGLVEVVVALPDGTTLSEINSDEPLEAASLYKLAVMVEVFREREMGELSFDEELVLDGSYFLEEDSAFAEADIGYAVSIETLLQTMITLSSNVAATALLSRVGNESVNLTMESLGLVATEIRWSPDMFTDEPPLEDEEPPAEDEPASEEPPIEEDPADDEGSNSLNRSLLHLPHRQPLLDPRADAALNVTTAADIAALYVMLINGQIISESVSQEMLLLLKDQQINDRLPAYLPEDTIVAHKTGNLDGLIHDAGIIFAPTGPV
ncbi:MAG: class A beta-lactamase-related serine hydrolase, partial [Chloroflexota bacterium]|nr:class A beta-lactamase-related serine hydrolase [Chloroflexota bacterium]